MKQRKFNFSATNQMLQQSSTREPEQVISVSEENIPEVKEESRIQSIIKEIEEPISSGYNFKFVPREKMKFHKNNKYPMESIEKLGDEILNYGLIHNIEVLYDEDNDEYIIESGERRTRAIDLLIKTYRDYSDTESPTYRKYLKNVKSFERGYPCKVVRGTEDSDMDEIDSEIRLIIANESVREKNPVETKKHIDRLKELYEAKKAVSDKDEPKINVNVEIGDKLKLTDRMIKKYNSLNKLIPELLEKFEENQISLSEGANYSQLTEEEQQQILKMIENGNSKKEANQLSEQLNRMKLEIQAKEREIATLAGEKDEAQKAVSEFKAQAKELRKQIKKELEEKDPNKEKISHLELQLQENQKLMNQEKRNLKDTIAYQQQMIDDLQKQLKKKADSSNKDPELIKAEAQLENSIRSINRECGNLRTAYENMQKISGDINPTHIEHIEHVIKCLSSLIKKK